MSDLHLSKRKKRYYAILIVIIATTAMIGGFNDNMKVRMTAIVIHGVSWFLLILPILIRVFFYRED